MSIEDRVENLTQYLKGWLGYYYIADMKTHLQNFRGWIRRRLRTCMWKQWKNIKTRIRNLRKLGIEEEETVKFSNSRKGYWRLSKSQQLHQTLNNKFWSELGLVNLVPIYLEHRK